CARLISGWPDYGLDSW
nr:immunoglobulin heavy chain junction region [Macaca mulatta]MOV52661.1 immunoglobulin heavy chain junction region [Macaca mulatta]